ncbi:MAG: hypothetical protein PVI39_11390, partial [Desulfobacteraceae bacterium]
METDAAGFQKVQTAFNRLLLGHLSRLGVGEKDEGPSLERIETLTILYLMHERGNGIGPGGDPPAGGCSRSDLLADLADIDPQGASNASNALDQLIAGGLVAVNGEQAVALTPRAAEKVALYDAAFPGMPGLSFVAYLLQTMQEVSSGRKPLTAALEQVDQTLRVQGRPQGCDRSIVARGENGGPAGNRLQTAARGPWAPPSARLQQLYRLRQAGSDATPQPRIVTRSGCTAQVAVKTLFPREKSGPPDGKSATAEPGTETLATAVIEGAAKQVQPPSGDGPLAPVAGEAGDLPAGAEGQDRSPQQDESRRPDGSGLASEGTTGGAGEPSHGVVSEPDQKRTPAGGAAHAPHAEIPRPAVRPSGAEDPAVGEPAVDAAAPETARPAGGPTGAGGSPEFKLPAADGAEAAGKLQPGAAAIKKDQTIDCPICSSGSVQPATTPKGKTYYACSRAGCNFISWGRPHPYPC